MMTLKEYSACFAAINMKMNYNFTPTERIL